MRVLAVSHACVVDANQTLYRWVEQAPGIELQLIVPRTWKGDLVGEARFQRLGGLRSPVVELPAVFSGRGSLHFYRGAAATVGAFRPDLIFLDEEPWSLCALQFAVLAWWTSARLVFYTKENLRRRYPLPLRWIERYVFSRSAAAAVISTEAEAVLRAKGFQGRILTLPHGFEPEWFQPRRSARAHTGDAIVIGYLGRLTPEKGVADLIAAVQAIRTRTLQTAIHLLVIGNGNDAGSLKNLVRQFGLEEVATFLPAVPHNKVAALYNCLDVVVVPSRTTPQWKEQFGRVLIEAMASGVCVVGSDSGEIPIVIGDAGVVFREGDVDSLAAALHQLIVDGPLRELLTTRGLARAARLYSNSVIAAQTLRIWSEAMYRNEC